MKEYTIYYIGFEDGKEMLLAGSGQGHSEEEAIRDFYFWYDNCIKITSVEFYRTLSR